MVVAGLDAAAQLPRRAHGLTCSDLASFSILQVDYTFPPNAIVSPECKDLLARILIDNPDKRITVQQILRHPWYQKVRLLFAVSCGYTRLRGCGGQLAKARLNITVFTLQLLDVATAGVAARGGGDEQHVPPAAAGRRCDADSRADPARGQRCEDPQHKCALRCR